MSGNESAGPEPTAAGSGTPPTPPAPPAPPAPATAKPPHGPPTPGPEDGVWPYIGVGCLTTVIGLFGGGMIAMLVGKVTDAVTGCRPPAGLPVCTWWRYWWTGALVGAVLLPVIAVRRLRHSRRMAEHSTGTR